MQEKISKITILLSTIAILIALPTFAIEWEPPTEDPPFGNIDFSLGLWEEGDGGIIPQNLDWLVGIRNLVTVNSYVENEGLFGIGRNPVSVGRFVGRETNISHQDDYLYWCLLELEEGVERASAGTMGGYRSSFDRGWHITFHAESGYSDGSRSGDPVDSSLVINGLYASGRSFSPVQFSVGDNYCIGVRHDAGGGSRVRDVRFIGYSVDGTNNTDKFPALYAEEDIGNVQDYTGSSGARHFLAGSQEVIVDANIRANHPTSSSHVATKGYVDAQAVEPAVTYKTSCQYRSTRQNLSPPSPGSCTPPGCGSSGTSLSTYCKPQAYQFGMRELGYSTRSNTRHNLYGYCARICLLD